jgi:shikimate dehydrogenase
MSKKFAVLGSPISHSLSPAIHAAAYEAMGETWTYDRFQVESKDLEEFLIKSQDIYSGFSLTMPLKEAAYGIASFADSVSSTTKATNTLVRSGNNWNGFNTDVFGITQSIAATVSGEVKNVLVLGSGATAVSAVTAIAESFPGARISVHARNVVKVSQLLKFAKNLGTRARRVRFVMPRLAGADIVISTLPSGVLNEFASKLSVSRRFRPRGVLLDVAYNPWPSEIAKVWSNSGSVVISGKEMLIWQALAQIRIFKTGDASIPLVNEVHLLQVMRAAAQQ